MGQLDFRMGGYFTSVNRDLFFRRTIITLVSIWLVLFALIPHLLILVSSFIEQDQSLQHSWLLTLTHYKALLNPLYFRVFWRSLGLASICTVITLMLGYPFAWALAQSQSRYQHVLLVLVIIPFWTSSLIRTYAIIAILKVKGLLNTFLLGCGLIHQPLQLLYTNTAVIIGLVYDLLPFMVLPLYANFKKLDFKYWEAAQDLGASTRLIFFRIMLPLTLPGILGGSLLVFLPAMSLFYIPDLLGGSKSLFLGNLIQRQFLMAHHWSLGAAMSIAFMGLLTLLLIGYGSIQKRGIIHQNLL